MEPSRPGGENAQKTRKNGEKMGEIWPKKCEQGRDRRDHLEHEDAKERDQPHLEQEGVREPAVLVLHGRLPDRARSGDLRLNRINLKWN